MTLIGKLTSTVVAIFLFSAGIFTMYRLVSTERLDDAAREQAIAAALVQSEVELLAERGTNYVQDEAQPIDNENTTALKENSIIPEGASEAPAFRLHEGPLHIQRGKFSWIAPEIHPPCRMGSTGSSR